MRSLSILLLGCSLALSGCSMLTESIARRASDMAVDSAFRAAKDVEMNRRLHLTLVGGSHLNQGKGTQPKPVQACVYVVLSPEWHPPMPSLEGGCGSKEKETGVVAISRQVVAPNQIVQLEILLAATRDAWLVIDADFAQRPTSYRPLRLPVEGRGWVHLSAWLEEAAIHDGKKPLPAPSVAAAPEAAASAVAPVVAQESPPTVVTPARKVSKRPRRAPPPPEVSP